MHILCHRILLQPADEHKWCSINKNYLKDVFVTDFTFIARFRTHLLSTFMLHLDLYDSLGDQITYRRSLCVDCSSLISLFMQMRYKMFDNFYMHSTNSIRSNFFYAMNIIQKPIFRFKSKVDHNICIDLMLMKLIMNSLIHTNSPSNFNIPKVIFTDRFMRIVVRLYLVFSSLQH